MCFKLESVCQLQEIELTALLTVSLTHDLTEKLRFVEASEDTSQFKAGHDENAKQKASKALLKLLHL